MKSISTVRAVVPADLIIIDPKPVDLPVAFGIFVVTWHLLTPSMAKSVLVPAALTVTVSVVQVLAAAVTVVSQTVSVLFERHTPCHFPALVPWV